jgi:hypothetical protein
LLQAAVAAHLEHGPVVRGAAKGKTPKAPKAKAPKAKAKTAQPATKKTAERTPPKS